MSDASFGRGGRPDDAVPSPAERVPPLQESMEKITAFMGRVLELTKKRGRSSGLVKFFITRPSAAGGIDVENISINFETQRFDNFRRGEPQRVEDRVWLVESMKTVADADTEESEYELRGDGNLYFFNRRGSISELPPSASGYRDSAQIEEDEDRRHEEIGRLLDDPGELVRRLEKMRAGFKKDREGKEVGVQLGIAAANPEDAARLARLFASPDVEVQLVEMEAKVAR